MRCWLIAICVCACGSSHDALSDAEVIANDGGRDSAIHQRDASTADRPYLPLPGSCGLEAPAFCDTFEAGPMGSGRAGELDASLWSAARTSPLDVTFEGQVMWIGPWRTP